MFPIRMYLSILCVAIVAVTSSAKKPPLRVNLDAIAKVPFSDFDKLMDFTSPEYREYASGGAGKEHYPALYYFSQLFRDSDHPFIDIGTRVGTSMLTMAASGHPVETYDIPVSTELQTMVRNTLKMEWATWQEGVAKTGGSVTVKKANLLDVPHEEFAAVMKADFIMLDTYHKPFTKPFEREFFQKVLKWSYEGIMLLDDVYLNKEMRTWFAELVCNNTGAYEVYDLTVVGHATGTAMINFSPSSRSVTVYGTSPLLLSRIERMRKRFDIASPPPEEVRKKVPDATYVISPVKKEYLPLCSAENRHRRAKRPLSPAETQ